MKNDSVQENFACYRDEKGEEMRLEKSGLSRRLDAMGIGYKSVHIECDGSCWLNLSGTHISDLSVLKDVPVTHLCLQGCYRITDLSALKGTNVHWLNISRTRVMELSPLKNLPLTDLKLYRTQITNLAPLRETSVRSLDIRSTGITDLSPLRRVPLNELLFFPARIRKGIRSLCGIKTLERINRRPAEDFWARYRQQPEA